MNIWLFFLFFSSFNYHYTMFLEKFNKLQNSNRHRRFLKWSFLNKFLLKKKKKNLIFPNIKLKNFYLKNLYINFNKRFYFNFSDSNKSCFSTPLAYGFLFGNIGSQLPYDIFFKKKYFFKNIYLFFLKPGNLFFYLSKGNSIFIKSKGTFGSILRHEWLSNRTLVKLPSKQKKFFSIFNKCYVGRNYDIFHKYVILGSFGFKKKYTLKKKPKVRGVAMNPVDHPNGGRTKVKKPFKNKFNKIAKNNK